MISSQTSSNEPKQNRFLKVHPFKRLECKLQKLIYPFPRVLYVGMLHRRTPTLHCSNGGRARTTGAPPRRPHRGTGRSPAPGGSLGGAMTVAAHTPPGWHGGTKTMVAPCPPSGSRRRRARPDAHGAQSPWH
jgi:hypothetical protein